jgi:hypothetical protein
MVVDDLPLMTRILVTAGLFHSDPRLEGLMVDHVTPMMVLGGLLAGASTSHGGSSHLIAPWIHAFQFVGQCVKSLLYAGVFQAVDII